MDIIELLDCLPHNDWRGQPQMTAPDCYPAYVWAAREIKPYSILEIGAFQGFGLLSFFYGYPIAGRLAWVDNESYRPDTNREAEENIRWAVDKLGLPLPTLEADRSRGELDYSPGSFGLIHVDGDHSYTGCYDDLQWALDMRPRVVLVDDFLYDFHAPEVQRAVFDVARQRNLQFTVWPSFRGWAVFTDELLPRWPVGSFEEG